MSLFLILFFIFSNFNYVYSIQVSTQSAFIIAEKVWKNECNGTIEGLTSWNKSEDFASLGIGHFIWYPKGKEKKFEETFPELLTFIKSQGKIIPNFLENLQACPWKDRETFYKNNHDTDMVQLRQFLYETRDSQALFLVYKLEQSIPLMVQALPNEKRKLFKKRIHELAQDSKGLYALIDYLNFKGLGISKKETYKNQGWGLLQVINSMPENEKPMLQNFVTSAKCILKQRINNAPSERNEEHWLQGWFKRIDTYLN